MPDLLQKPYFNMAASEILICDRVISVPVMSDVTEVTCQQTTVTLVKTFGMEGMNLQEE
jgi:hypothetical protein